MKTPTTALAWLIFCRTLPDSLSAEKIKRKTAGIIAPLAIGQATVICALLEAMREGEDSLTDYGLGKRMEIGGPSTKSLRRIQELGYIGEVLSAKGARRWKVNGSRIRECGRMEADLQALVDRTNRRIGA